MIKLKDILSEALPQVPMTMGFHKSEDYKKQIPEQFFRYYSWTEGDKSGRFIEMANRLMQVYGDQEVWAGAEKKNILQDTLESIDNASNEIFAYLSEEDSPYSVRSPKNPGSYEIIWEELDNIHEKVNEIINNSTFDKWTIDTAIENLKELQGIIDRTKDIFTSNYGLAPVRKKAGFKLYQ